MHVKMKVIIEQYHIYLDGNTLTCSEIRPGLLCSFFLPTMLLSSAQKVAHYVQFVPITTAQFIYVQFYYF